MRNRIGSTTGIAAIWMLLILGLVATSESVAPIHERMKLQRAELDEHASTIRTLSLGSSHASGLDLDAFGGNGFNMWQSGGDLHEAAFIATDLAPQLPALQCIFISMSPASLHADNGAPTPTDRAARRRELYARTASTRFIPGDERQLLMGKLSPLVREDHWKEVVKGVLGMRKPERIRADGSPVLPDFAHVMPEDSLRMDGVRTAARHEAWLEEVLRARPEAASGGYRALDAMFEQLPDSVFVVLYTTPYYESYVSAIPQHWLPEVRKAGRELAAHHDRVVYEDYSIVEGFADNAAYFRDSGHLNARGSDAFSRQLARKLRSGPAAACAQE